MALAAGSSQTARAQNSIEMTPISPSSTGSSGEVGADKSGPIMINFKLGPSIPVAYKDPTPGFGPLDVLPVAASITIEGGYALGRTRQAYITLPLQILTGTMSNVRITRVVVPVGFQYDIPIRAVPGLYIYPRLFVGYLAHISSSSNISITTNGMMFAPEFGAKYVFRKRLNFAFEPFSLPFTFTSGKDIFGRDSSTYYLEYRLNVSVGVNI